MDIQHYKDNIYISGQVNPNEVSVLVKDYGFSVIVNNRIDGEDLNQPESKSIKTACQESGVEYQYLPMRDRSDISAEAVVIRDEILQGHRGEKILFFCRTGGRCESLLSYK